MRIAAYTLTFLVLSIALFALSAGSLEKYHALAERGAYVDGHVIELDCDNHDTMRIAFSYKAKDFSFTDSNSVCRKLRGFSQIRVTFLENDPSVATTKNAISAFRGELLSSLLMALVGPALMLLLIRATWPVLVRRMYGQS